MNKEAPFYRIRDLDTSERPRERLEQKGADVLTNAELLAILLRVGVPGENAVQVGKLMDIEVLDHLVIGNDCFISMKDKDLGF